MCVVWCIMCRKMSTPIITILQSWITPTQVKWLDGRQLDDKNQGAPLAASTTAFEPGLTFRNILGILYAIFMIIVDNKFCAEKVHLLWAIFNVPEGNVKNGDIQHPYTPPNPPLIDDIPMDCFIIVAQQSRKLPGDGSVLSTTPILGQATNTLRRVDFKQLIENLDLEVTGLSTFKPQPVVST